MALKDRIHDDLTRVYMNQNHFAEEHTWNGRKLICVTDDEVALKRKNNNVVDLSWDNNTTETLVYVPREGFPGRAKPNEQVLFDNRPMTILQVQDDMGMLAILLVSRDPKAVRTR